MNTSPAASRPDPTVGIAIGGQYVELSPAELAEAQKNLMEAAKAAGVSEKQAKEAAEEKEALEIQARLESARSDDVPEWAPGEIWILQIKKDPMPGWQPGGEEWNARPRFVNPVDEAGDPLLVFRSFEDAVESAIYHKFHYEIDCRPVRIK